MANYQDLKYYLFATTLAALLTGCQALKPASQSSIPAQPPARQTYLEQVSLTTAPVTATVVKKEAQIPDIQEDSYSPKFYFNQAFDIEQSLDQQFRYAILMDVEVEQLANQALYNYISDWWGTPYRMGGDTKRGIDCSAFVQGLMVSVYGVSLPRVAREQKNSCRSLSAAELQEGDLLFFNTRGGVSHVGVYLHNNYFVHASTSGGITISSLNESYWQRRYLGAGRPSGSGEPFQTATGQ